MTEQTATTATTTATVADTSTTALSESSRTNYLLVASYLCILIVWVVSQIILIPYVVHLLVLVTCILYAACHSSIVLLHEKDEVVIDKDGNETIIPAERETLRKEDAYQFPLVGSASLFSLYLAFKFLDKEMVNLLIGFYFGILGAFAVTMTIAPCLALILPSNFSKEIQWVQHLHHPFTWKRLPVSPMSGTLSFTATELVAFVVAIGVCIMYFQSKPWYLNNVLGISFCLQGIERFSLGTYKIGAILLIGLFFYDIFWVFGTEVMVSVAKNLDGPIKILFPRSFERNLETNKLKDLSLLGLGDIVIPGFFLALLLRFDAHNAAIKAGKEMACHIHDSFPKPYFHSALVAYIAGLGTTLFVMMKFNAAQPALLYLVPACLGSSLLCAFARGEMKELFEYSEEQEEPEGEANIEETDGTKKDN